MTPQALATDDTLEDGQRCMWGTCTKVCPDAELLYAHLCNDHVGRKSTNNLCLTCKWKDCDTACAKRDHITSHLRVHTPLKPHLCEICNKTFKRPQDLKKHEKIHTEEHHVQHKHSKAITVTDPSFSQRVRGPVPTPAHVALDRSSASSASSDRDSGTPGTTPEFFLNQDLIPTWETLSSHSHDQHASSSNKRSHDSTLDDFFSDVKKRKVQPTYDPQMAERLSTLEFANQLLGGTVNDPAQLAPFNPRSVSLDIRTPEELAAVNSFLVALGRDLAGAAPQPAAAAQPSYFDTASLLRYGLLGMPGIDAAAFAAYTQPAAAYTQPAPAPVAYPEYSSSALYPQLGASAHRPQPTGALPSIAADFRRPAPTPPHQSPLAARGSLSPLSSASTPLSGAGTPPQLPALYAQVPSPARSPPHLFPQHAPSPPQLLPHHAPSPPQLLPHHAPSPPQLLSHAPSPPQLLQTPAYPASYGLPDTLSFDTLRAPRGSTPAAQLAPLDRAGHVVRTVLPLRSAPQPVEPPLAPRPPPALPARLASLSAAGPARRVAYPTLDRALKLPALRMRDGTPAMRIRESAPPADEDDSESSEDEADANASASSTPSPRPGAVVLPSLASAIARHTPPPPADRERERERHAGLIRDLLVFINNEFASKLGLESPPRRPTPPPRRDVEMIAA